VSAAAPARQRVLAQARYETVTLLRNGEQLLVALVLPVAVLIGVVHATFLDLGPGRRVDVAVPGVLALCVLSSAFTGQAISTAFDRRYGVLRLLGATPLGRGGLLAAKAVAVLAVVALQVVVVGAVGLAMGWEPSPRGIPAAVLSLALGSATFAALALLLGGTVRAEGVLALANLLWVAMLALGGVVIAASRVWFLPSAALGDALRAALVDGSVDWRAWAVLAAWGAVAALLARRWFRWDD
jgi:ABC-2 type transport system permease protein